MAIEKYEHHGRTVSVQSDLKGRHRQHCLCYDCDGFQNDCPIARAVYSNCVKFGIVTPVWECPDYRPATKD